MNEAYDALIVVSFGGPEGPDEVLPFLENVVRGRNVPRERLLEVAEQYQRFGGVSPLNAHNRALVADLEKLLDARGPRLKVYFGNRNWRPYLKDTVAQMAADGVRRAVAFVTAAYSSYSSCRQYLEDIERARAEVGPGAPAIDKLRPFFNHPGFVEPLAELLATALAEVPAERRAAARVVFTAHSIPLAMAAGCQYEAQLQETSRLVAERAGAAQWKLAFQSRSGPPTQPWLEPDVCDYLTELAAAGARDVVVQPVGFVAEHMEVLFDLDTETREVAERLGINMIRAATVGRHPRFLEMIRELIVERMNPEAERQSIGALPPRPISCAPDCCPSGTARRA